MIRRQYLTSIVAFPTYALLAVLTCGGALFLSAANITTSSLDYNEDMSAALKAGFI